MAHITIPSGELTEFDLPRVCVVTGATEDIVFKDVKFQWYPRWVAALILINILIAAVVALALTKRVKGKLPFTEVAYAAWRRGVWTMLAAWFGAVVLFLFGLGGLMSGRMALGTMASVGCIALPLAVWLKLVRNRNVICTRIADGQITLRVPSDAAALAIREHLHGGAVVPAVAVEGSA